MKYKKDSNIYCIQAFLALLFITSIHSELNANNFLSDTLIIDGKSVRVEVKEGEEYPLIEEELFDSLASKLFRSKMLGFTFSGGISFNTINSNPSNTSLNEFVENNKTKGSFQNKHISFLCETQRNFWLGANLGISNWNVGHNSYTDGLTDNFWAFESLQENTLNRIDSFPSNIGFEHDTVQVDLQSEVFKSTFYSLGMRVGKEIFKQKTNKKLRLMSFIGLNAKRIRSYSSEEFHFMDEKSWYTRNSKDLEKTKLEFETSLEFLCIYNVNKKISVAPSVKFVKVISDSFSIDSEFNFTGNGFGAGLSFFFLIL